MMWTEESATACAEWWWEKIAEGRFDNGGADPVNALAGAMAGMLADIVRPGPEKRGGFVAICRDTLLARQPRTLHVDYEPWWDLADIAGMAGIDPHAFPWKSSSDLRPDGVYGSSGYGQPMERIWPPAGADVPC